MCGDPRRKQAGYCCQTQDSRTCAMLFNLCDCGIPEESGLDVPEQLPVLGSVVAASMSACIHAADSIHSSATAAAAVVTS